MWLAKLNRMMDELPGEYLQPLAANPEISELIPPGSQPVSRLTDEEKGLYGVYRQLGDFVKREDEAHIALHHQGDNQHSVDASCAEHAVALEAKADEAGLIIAILMLSLKERLGGGRDYIFDGYDIYTISDQDVEVVPEGLEIPDPDDWPETKH